MLSEKNILINDTCVIFDLIDLNLIHEFFKLKYSFFSTPQVLGEIKDDNQYLTINRYVENKILSIDNNGTFESISDLFDKYPGLSFADCSVLELTSRIDGVLLSSDKSLRKISKNSNLEVRGVLWIIDKLVTMKIIPPEMAITKLEEYHKFNVRIPIKEINLLINRLKESTK